MIDFDFHKDFKKEYKKLPLKIQLAFKERLGLFCEDPAMPLLKNHHLTGSLKGKYAFSVSGDVRVIYRIIGKESILLLRIGTHNQVY